MKKIDIKVFISIVIFIGSVAMFTLVQLGNQCNFIWSSYSFDCQVMKNTALWLTVISAAYIVWRIIVLIIERLKNTTFDTILSVVFFFAAGALLILGFAVSNARVYDLKIKDTIWECRFMDLYDAPANLVTNCYEEVIRPLRIEE